MNTYDQYGVAYFLFLIIFICICYHLVIYWSPYFINDVFFVFLYFKAHYFISYLLLKVHYPGTSSAKLPPADSLLLQQLFTALR